MNSIYFIFFRSTSSIAMPKKKKSPTKEELDRTNKILKAKIKLLQQKVRRLQRREKKILSKEETSEEQTKVESKELILLKALGKKYLPEQFNILLSAQVDAQIRNKRGMRYDSEYKKFALSIYFLSPRTYKELKTRFTLPSVRTLQSFTQKWNIVCILCADEMSLKSYLFYDISRDEIVGFEDTGVYKSPKPAKSAIVLMARSTAGNWKVPLCYCFAETTCASNILKQILFTCIIKLKNSGAIVHAFVTDMGSNFLKLSRELGISTKNSVFVVD